MDYQVYELGIDTQILFPNNTTFLLEGRVF